MLLSNTQPTFVQKGSRDDSESNQHWFQRQTAGLVFALFNPSQDQVREKKIHKSCCPVSSQFLPVVLSICDVLTLNINVSAGSSTHCVHLICFEDGASPFPPVASSRSGPKTYAAVYLPLSLHHPLTRPHPLLPSPHQFVNTPPTSLPLSISSPHSTVQYGKSLYAPIGCQ